MGKGRSTSVQSRSIDSHMSMRATTHQSKLNASKVPSAGYNDSNARSMIPDMPISSINKRPTTGVAGKGVTGSALGRVANHGSY